MKSSLTIVSLTLLALTSSLQTLAGVGTVKDGCKIVIQPGGGDDNLAIDFEKGADGHVIPWVRVYNSEANYWNTAKDSVRTLEKDPILSVRVGKKLENESIFIEGTVHSDSKNTTRFVFTNLFQKDLSIQKPNADGYIEAGGGTLVVYQIDNAAHTATVKHYSEEQSAYSYITQNCFGTYYEQL